MRETVKNENRKLWIELAGAVALIGGSTVAVLAQGGGPPPVPICYSCQPSPGRCGLATIAAKSCCCCYSTWTALWGCNAQTPNFDCTNPPFPWQSCFQVV